MRKKLLTLLTLALLGIGSAWAETAVLSWYMGENGADASANNSITGASGCAAEGFTIAISGNSGKNWSNGNGDITYNGVKYKTLKNSNGAQNTITCPEGCVATNVVFYVVSNADSSGKLSEIDGETCNDEVISHKDYSNPTVITKTIDRKKSFTFTFSTKQVCFIAVVTYISKPDITTQPLSATYQINDTPTALTVAAIASAGELSYQWFSCDDTNKTNEAAISGETNTSYTPSTASAGKYYYFCRVTDAKGSTDSEVATVTVSEANAPTISLDSYSYSTMKGSSVTFTATTTGVPTPTVTWYQNETATTTGGVEKGTGNTFSPDVTAGGTFYFYAVASNGVGSDATSEVITLTVTDIDVIVSGNSYYIGKDETPLPDEKIICDDITMTFVNGKAGESFTESVFDEHIKSINSNYLYSISGSSSNNGWKAQFAPTVAGKLKVGVVINNKKTFSITNVTSFSYNGFNNKGDAVSETINGNSFTTGSSSDDKLYVEVTIYVEGGKEYALSVAGSKMGFFGFNFEPVPQVSGTITASGYNTYSSNYPLDLSTINGGTAYVATSVIEGKVVLTKCTDKVPAATGLFIAGTADETFTINTTSEKTTAPAANLLVGMPNGGTVNKAAVGEFNYVFGWTDKANPGFYLINATAAELGNSKAYLNTTSALTAPTSARLSLSFGGETTGIDEAVSEATAGSRFFDLQGRRVAQPTKGLYIVNGKKVIIK